MAFQRQERIGSSKLMRASDMRGEVLMVDRGFTSVFDRGPIAGFESGAIAIARTTQAEAIFRLLKAYGINTHYVDREDATTLRVKESRVRDLPLLSGFASARMLGLEVLCRLRATKKFCQRVQKGEIPLAKLEHHVMGTLEPGMKFRKPYVEFSTKWKAGGDMYLTDLRAVTLTESSEQDIREVLDLGVKVAEILEHFTFMTGFELDDFKIEVAKEYGLGGRFCVIDGITVDEMGVRKDGELYGKNPIRFYYEEHHPEWVKALKAAQKARPEDKESWPEYPPLPSALKQMQITKYRYLAHVWTDYVNKLG